MTTAIVAQAYGDPEVLELVELDAPAPGAREVTIAVKASGINPADLKRLRGRFGRNEAALPLRLGSEVSGIVTAIGAGAEGPGGPLSVGDEVIAYPISGGFSQAITVAADKVVPKPANLGWEQAAGLLLAGVTAYHLLETTGVKTGDRVIVHGASGGVGLTAVQLAKLRGAEVVGTVGPGSADRVRAYGATPVAYGPGLVDRIRAIFPDGADAALDAIGTEEAIDSSVELVADTNRIATVVAFDYGASRGVKGLGSGPGADPGTGLRAAARLPLAQLAGEGKLEVLVAKTFPLAEAAAALRFIEQGHPGGKVVLLP